MGGGHAHGVAPGGLHPLQAALRVGAHTGLGARLPVKQAHFLVFAVDVAGLALTLRAATLRAQAQLAGDGDWLR